MPVPKSNSAIRLFADRVEKLTPDPALTASKYRALHEVAASGEFLAANVIDQREDRIVLQRIHHLTSIRELYISSDPRLDAAVEKCGQVLAMIHGGLSWPGQATWQPSKAYERDLKSYIGREIAVCALPQVVLHGDYSFTNLFIRNESDVRVVVLDPCPNYSSTHHEWERGPIYVDIGKMLSCLEGQVPARFFFSRPPPNRVRELQRLFISGYSRFAGEIDERVAHAFAYANVSEQFRRRFGGLGLLRRNALYNWLRGNYPAFQNRTDK